MPKLNNTQLNEKYDQLISEMESFRLLMAEVQSLNIENINSNIREFSDAYDDLFEPILDHENEVRRVPKAQWFDEKFDDINTRIKELDKFEKSINELQKRAEKLTQAVTENATFGSFKDQAKIYRSFSKAHAIGGYLSLLLIPVFIILFSIFVEPVKPEEWWNYIRNFFLTSAGIGALASIFIATNNAKSSYIKLAADYEYKATLSEALIGYRKLHQITYEDDEYKTLFKKLSETLTFNPASHIIGVKENEDKKIHVANNSIIDDE